MPTHAENSCRMQRTQHRVNLLSRRAYDSLGRILDLLCKMEFELTQLRIVNTSGEVEIDMSFLPLGIILSTRCCVTSGRSLELPKSVLPTWVISRRSSNGAQTSSLRAEVRHGAMSSHDDRATALLGNRQAMVDWARRVPILCVVARCT